jgi:hypothetical protein
MSEPGACFGSACDAGDGHTPSTLGDGALANDTPLDGTVSMAPCWPDAEPPACDAGVDEGVTCDGSLAVCRLDDDGQVRLMLCRNVLNGIALEWTQINTVTVSCTDRADACNPISAPNIDAQLATDLRLQLGGCLGNDHSWGIFSFADGCPSSFVTSRHDAASRTCVDYALRRYSCLTGPACAGVMVTTSN